MAQLCRKLPARAWQRIYRVTGTISAVSVILSVVLTNLFMETFSAGLDVPGMLVSIVVPLALGTPMLFMLMLKHERLRYANSQLEYLASTDWLTACLNRGAFTGAVIRHLQRRNGDERGALLIVDADDFKSVNDRFGHDHGDEALRRIAGAIRDTVGGDDLVGRLGGEEFGILLVSADATAADVMAERIRSAVAATAFAPNGKLCPLSVSIGGALCTPGTPFNDIYRLADRHLYEAKHAGRDRVAIAHAA